MLDKCYNTDVNITSICRILILILNMTEIYSQFNRMEDNYDTKGCYFF